MRFLDIGNIVLTKGESSDLFEITSDTSLSDYKAKMRISNPSGVEHEEELKHSQEVKNNDSIFNDDLIVNYKAEKYSFAGSIQDETQTEVPFIHKIKITDIQKDSLNEEATITGKVFKIETKDTVTPGVPPTPGAITTQEVEVGIENAKVTVSLTSETKQITREGTALTNSSGEFTIKIFLGETVRVPARQAILFQIPSSLSETLDAGRYYCTVTVFKEELDKSISFQKEVLQTKLDINEKN